MSTKFKVLEKTIFAIFCFDNFKFLHSANFQEKSESRIEIWLIENVREKIKEMGTLNEK